MCPLGAGDVLRAREESGVQPSGSPGETVLNSIAARISVARGGRAEPSVRPGVTPGVSRARQRRTRAKGAGSTSSIAASILCPRGDLRTDHTPCSRLLVNARRHVRPPRGLVSPVQWQALELMGQAQGDVSEPSRRVRGAKALSGRAVRRSPPPGGGGSGVAQEAVVGVVSARIREEGEPPRR
jgi:hypothetical protein